MGKDFRFEIIPFFSLFILYVVYKFHVTSAMKLKLNSC